MPLLSSIPSAFRGIFRRDEVARAVYSEAAGIAQIIPKAVAVPVDADDVVTLVRWAAAEQLPLIARGSGSSMAGGAIGDGVIVDLSRLNGIGDVNVDARTIRCGPGAIRNAVDTRAREAQLTFPVDPSSGKFCTVGGMASTNAAGPHTMLYGAMRQWVEALDCVFADGSRAEVRRGAAPPDNAPMRRFLEIASSLADAEHAAPSRHEGVRKESSGYGLSTFATSRDPIDLLVGSEGTLVLIVGLELRLARIRPSTASLLGAFDCLDDAVVGARSAREAGACACELLDRTFLDVARRGGASVPVPDDAESVLMVEFEGDSIEECTARVVALEEQFRADGARHVSIALDADTEHTMWELRHAASPALSRLDPALKSMQFIEDGCVPPHRLADYVTGVRAALNAQGIRGVIFGHAGDAHMHVNPLVDVRLPDWRDRADALLAEVSALTAQLGGTLSGEHGDGRLRAPLMHQVWSPETLERFGAVKRAFDPMGILNPGAKLPAEGARPIEHVKYDPALRPLPPNAREVLRIVERDRAYARPRLEILADVGDSVEKTDVLTLPVSPTAACESD